ncbi:MAG TPA: xylulokinase [bacterium]|nr:xylulokinase [bacterium]
MKGLYAGLDVSTQGCKLVVIDVASGGVVFVDAVQYDTDLPQYGTKNGVRQNQPEGVSESDPNMWIEAVETVISRLRASDVPIAQIRCISVSGQQHGLVSLDASGRLTRPYGKLWNDFSTLEECRVLTEKAGGDEAMIREVGNTQRTGYTAPKIFHMVRHEPDVYAKTATLFLVHNYINFYLTGGVRVMEPGDGSGMALWHPGTRKWSDKVIRMIAPDLASKLPEIRPSDETIGTVAPDLVKRFGFSPDCRIDAGSGDNMYGAVGTGNVEPGIVTISLGTSGTAYTMMEKPYIDPKGEIAAFCDSTGRWLPLLCVSNLANGYNEILKIHGIGHDQFEQIVRKTEPGNAGRILIPWYVGERTPDVPQASPVYFGFGLDDFTQDKLCRAVVEGHILNLYDGFRRMPVKAREIRVTGGLSKSEIWCQTIADVFEAEAVPVEGEGAALGAALHAAWVWQKENGEPTPLSDIVAPFVIFDESRRKNPIPENVRVYKKQKVLFSALSARIRGAGGEDPFALRAKMG